MFTLKKQHLWFVLFIAILAVSGLLLVSGQAQGAEKPSTTFADSPLEPLQIVTLSGSPEPLIGQVATIHIEVLSKYDAKDASIGVDLPDGVELVEGDLVWQGALTANQIQVHELSVRVQKEGHWRLWVSAHSQLADQRSFGDGETLHLITSVDSAKFIRGRDYRITIPLEGMPIPEIPANQVIVVKSAPAVLGQVTLEGVFEFEARETDDLGSAPALVTNDLKRAKVEVWDYESNNGERFLTEMTYDPNTGKYSATVPNDDPDDPDGVGINPLS